MRGVTPSGRWIRTLEGYESFHPNDLPPALEWNRSLVRELHEKLMRGVRGEHATPGEFRRSQNWIGRPGCTLAEASYVPPPAAELMDFLGRWEAFLHEESLPPLVQAALMHYQFEAIHPFLDGNGRVGRLLITLFLVERRLLPTPLLYLSAFFEATRRDYYDGLRSVTDRGDWDGWVQYFLNGVARQSEDALSRAEQINEQTARWRDKLSGGGSRVPLLLLDMIGNNPYVTVRGAERKLKVAYNTALRGIERLEKAGIVTEVSEAKRDRVYCAKALLEILEEPARLTPMEGA
jgi:Fic family protein